jgi:hypothetical protein
VPLLGGSLAETVLLESFGYPLIDRFNGSGASA